MWIASVARSFHYSWCRFWSKRHWLQVLHPFLYPWLWHTAFMGHTTLPSVHSLWVFWDWLSNSRRWFAWCWKWLTRDSDAKSLLIRDLLLARSCVHTHSLVFSCVVRSPLTSRCRSNCALSSVMSASLLATSRLSVWCGVPSYCLSLPSNSSSIHTKQSRLYNYNCQLINKSTLTHTIQWL